MIYLWKLIFDKKKTPVKCEVDNKNEITTQDFLEKNTSEIVDMCVVLRRNIHI